MNLLRLLILIAFVAPIVPMAADLCCAVEGAACSSVLSESGVTQRISASDCDGHHSSATACDTCALCHTSFVSTNLRSAGPFVTASATVSFEIAPDTSPVRLVLTPPPSLA